MSENDKQQLYKESVQDLLSQASAYVHLATEQEPWDYGWCIEEYRNSGTAAVSCNGRTYAIGLDGIKFYEVAVTKLLKMSDISAIWDPGEFWGTVASGVAYTSLSEDGDATSREVVQMLRNAPPSLVGLSLANIDWDNRPIGFSFGIIGKLDADYIAAVNAIADGNHKMTGGRVDRWINELFSGPIQSEDGSPVNSDIKSVPAENTEAEIQPCGATSGTGHRPTRPIIWSTWVPGQGDLAFRQAERQVENLVGVTLLLEVDNHSHNISMVRGSTNRPGIRGITFDRGAIEELLSPDHASEIVASTLIISSLGGGSGHRWESAHPLPLAKLLNQPALKADVEECLANDNPVTNRIKVAARWHMEAMWTTQRDDAALALGVALDSLIGSRSGLPGRGMKERFAFLEPDAASRGERADRYDKIFSVRSSVAHGGVSSQLEEADFIDLIAEDVSWAARRLLALYRRFKPNSEKDIDQIFEGFRWGTVAWPSIQVEEKD